MGVPVAARRAVLEAKTHYDDRSHSKARKALSSLSSRIMYYALLLLFYQRALRWYSAGRFMHAVKSLSKPYRLEFADIVEQMNERARSIERLGAAMAHNELRTMYQLVGQCLDEQKHLRHEQSKIAPALDHIQVLQNQTGSLLQNMENLMICMPRLAYCFQTER